VPGSPPSQGSNGAGHEEPPPPRPPLPSHGHRPPLPSRTLPVGAASPPAHSTPEAPVELAAKLVQMELEPFPAGPDPLPQPAAPTEPSLEAVEEAIASHPVPVSSPPPAGEPLEVIEGLPKSPLDEHLSVPLSSLVGAGGLLIGMVVAAFFVGRASSSAARLVAHPALAAVPAMVRAALPAPPKPCWMVKQPAMWAPHASRSIPFDAVATTRGTLALGYARDARQAVGIEVDLSSGEVKSRLDDGAKEEIERVVPTPSVEFHVARGGQGAGTQLHFPIEVPATAPFAVGLTGGGVALAAPPEGAPAPLWPLPGDDRLDAASVRTAGDRGFALVFRRGGAVWGGFVGADRKARGELVKVAGSGGAVGKPAAGWNGREVAVIFADRPEAEGRYEIRVGRVGPGAIPKATTVIPLPRGGPGGDAFAPEIAGLPDGRWLLMWTEGAAGSRAVRAQTFAPDFSPLGDPIALSPPAGNFGQGVIGVVGEYAATVFLSKGSSSYELWGAVLQCGG
jgi:hypothetical protein